MSLRDAIARAAYEAEWEGLMPEDGIQNALALQIADAVLAALRTELAAHPESIEELIVISPGNAKPMNWTFANRASAPDQENQ